MVRRTFSRVVVVGVLGLMGMSLGCGKSSLGPTSPSPSIAVASISPAAGLIGEVVRVTGTGFLPGATLTLDGVAARVLSLSSTFISATTPGHDAGPVDVVVTNPGGQRVTLTEGFTFEVVSLTASPSIVTPGGQVTVSWVAPEGRGCNGGGDWIALLTVSDPDTARGPFTHLCGAASGTSTLSAPAQPGQYEFRYMVGDVGAVARSNPVTVSASASPSI